ncbi:Uncharacterised protein [Mycobacteroides abscessus subsp. abscessus]|nr:Uncharacterised protein [Mycobacteroides abscessus subsp. abscessus]
MKLEPTEALRKAMHDALDDAIDQLMTLVGVGVGVPEGPPVGTIARRPDGEWIAWRTEDGWGYRFIGDEEPNEWPPGSNIADSWPVIYDPTSEKTREEKIQDYLEWSETQVDTDALDPIAQQEPGESLARGLDDIAAGRVSRRDDYLEPQQEPADRLDLIDPIQRHRGDKPSRTPRVVDRLGVDEQGSRWRNRAYTEFWFQDECWNFRTKDGCTSWFAAGYEPKMRIFTEILEPRVLPSLDCEEARDGTVWESRHGWRFWFNGEWRTDNGTRGKDTGLYVPRLLQSRSPYTEVLPDVG